MGGSAVQLAERGFTETRAVAKNPSATPLHRWHRRGKPGEIHGDAAPDNQGLPERRCGATAPDGQTGT